MYLYRTLVFVEGGKPKNQEKNIGAWTRTTTSSADVYRRLRGLNLGRMRNGGGGRHVLPPLQHPCSLDLSVPGWIIVHFNITVYPVTLYMRFLIIVVREWI